MATVTRPKLVLLVEDESIIAITLEDELIAAGYEVAGPFVTCTSALRWLEAGNPGVGVLDVSLRDGPCTQLARLLRDRGTPFVVYSGSSHASTAPEFQDAPWIGKPAPMGDLVEALRSLSDPARSLDGQG